MCPSWIPQLLLLSACAFAAGMRVAVIGDYGMDGPNELAVANMVKGWDTASPLTAVVTLGDNNYNYGEATTIQNNIGKYYGQFITNDPNTNKFWPCPGNHDWAKCNNPSGLDPYKAYFQALSTKSPSASVYDVAVGADLHFFMLDSDCNEPSGTTSTSQQGIYLQQQLPTVSAPFKIVAFHHPPYTSGSRPPGTTNMRWPFEDWGADVVLTGHEHVYERHDNPGKVAGKSGFPYITNGLGGASKTSFASIQPSSKFRYDRTYGAQLLTTRSVVSGANTQYELDMAFYDSSNNVIDCYRVIKVLVTATLAQVGSTTYASCTPASPSEFSLLTHQPPGPSPKVSWKYLNAGQLALDPADNTSWVTLAHEDGTWSAGVSPLGFGPDLSMAYGTNWTTYLPYNGAIPSGSAYYYFRYKFFLPTTVFSQLTNFNLKVMADNGARVYINGKLAHNDITANHEINYWNQIYSLAASAFLVAGRNVIAVQVSNTAGSDDMGFDLDLTYFRATALATGPSAYPELPSSQFSLISHQPAPTSGLRGPQATWQWYGPVDTALSATDANAWVSATFPAATLATWNTGVTPIGFGFPPPGIAAWKAPLAPNGGQLGYYHFRIKLCVPEIVSLEWSDITLRLLSNNGAIAWVNGVQVVDDLSADHTAAYWNNVIPKPLGAMGRLVAGPNIIAVLVKNPPSSPQAGFDFDITYSATSALSSVPTPTVC